MTKILQKSAESEKPRGHLDPADFSRNISFQTYVPPADLSLFVEHFWIIRWDAISEDYTSEQVMHRPYVDVFFSQNQSGIQGTFRGKRSYVAPAGSGRIIGIRFLPGAFHSFWEGDIAELQDKIIDLQQVFPTIDEQYIEKLLLLSDQAAIQQLVLLLRTKKPSLDTNIELINKIISAVENDEELQTVKAVAKATGRSERWLQQTFSDYIGLGLKWMLQRHKLLEAAKEIRAYDKPDWTAIAYDLGYSSQQHFITDFKKVLGKTPVQYKKELAES